MSSVASRHGGGDPGASPSVDGPRFDLRFDGGHGSLRLAQPLEAPFVTVDALELDLATVRFPLDITAGPARFRHRRAAVRRARVVVRLARLCELARACSMDLELTVGADGVVGRWCDAAGGDVTFDVRPAPGAADLSVRVRGATDLAERGRDRLLRAAEGLGLDAAPDASPEAMVLRSPVFDLLAEVLVPRGWRVPDAGRGAVALSAVDEVTVELELTRDGDDEGAS